MRLLPLLLLACADPALLPVEQAPVPQLLLDVDERLITGDSFTVRVGGTVAEGEVVLFAASLRGPGAGPCLSWAGGRCFGILSPVPVGQAEIGPDGEGLLELSPPALPPGSTLSLQALVVRGRNGAQSLLSAPAVIEIVDAIGGCTDSAAANYDPGATVDDGSCYGCAGSEGDFQPLSNTTLAGAHVYDRMIIPAGVTVRGGAAALDLVVCGPVQIDGVIDLSGGNGAQGAATAGLPNGASGGAGGVAVAGGHAGGRGGNSQSGSGSTGAGPGGGRPGGALLLVQPWGTFYDGGNGGGGGHSTAGAMGYQAQFTGTGGAGGPENGDAALSAFPSVGGSGGGGGSGGLGGASTGFGGGGGGAGGGVLRIDAMGAITVGAAGAIRANGGVSGSCQSTGAWSAGGGGSGGAIWLSGASLNNQGVVEARGGAPCGSAPGAGADGRIRVDLPGAAAPAGSFTPAVGYLGDRTL